MGLLIAVGALGSARAARELARDEGATTTSGTPYAPSPGSAPFVSLGYREAVADLLWVRMVGYFGGSDSTADGIGALLDAIVALDPRYHRVYQFGPRALTIAIHGVTEATYLHAIEILARGSVEFPDDWKLPYLAGQIYTQDLQTSDPKQRRAWDERGTTLIEAAIRRPNAPSQLATWAATMRTRLGQRQQAIDGLREMFLLASDAKGRQRIVEKLAELEKSNADELAAEMFEARHRFQDDWLANRPAIVGTFYVLLGPRPPPAFDLTELATGGRDLVEAKPIERLEPIE
jgi:hypothetical protein